MNRMLLIPALCCFSAFAVVLLVLHAAAGRETAARAARSGSDTLSPVAIENAGTPSAGDIRRSDREPEELLQKLSDEYVRPWRQWQNSPHRLYSRAAPRPVPSIAAEIAMSPQSAGAGKNVALATITIRTGLARDDIPCVVDRTTGQVHLFAAGKWVSSDEWVKTAPTPGKVALRE